MLIEKCILNCFGLAAGWEIAPAGLYRVEQG